MSRLPFEMFLALRYLRPRRTFVSVITIISILGVSLGVAVLIIVLSVMNGFDKEWREHILGFNAHLKIYKNIAGKGQVPLDDFTAVMNQVATNKNVTGISPFLRSQVLVKTQPEEGINPRYLAPLLIGIDPEAEGKVSVLPKSIVDGRFSVANRGLLIGQTFADNLGLAVGDKVAVYSPVNIEKMEAALKRGENEAVLASEFTVRGIFDVGYGEYNAMIVATSLEDAQELYNFPEDAVHGLQIRLTDAFLSETVRTQFQAALGPDFDVVTWQEESPDIFNALATEKSMMFFTLFFIMIVAAFGIINCQITFVVQKTRDIGLLKALGASHARVLWIFLSQSVVIGFLGVLSGLGLAQLALAYRNEFLAFMSRVVGRNLLPTSIYQLYDLPSVTDPKDIAIICGAAFFACCVAGLFPAWKAARLQPVEALRHE